MGWTGKKFDFRFAQSQAHSGQRRPPGSHVVGRVTLRGRSRVRCEAETWDPGACVMASSEPEPDRRPCLHLVRTVLASLWRLWADEAWRHTELKRAATATQLGPGEAGM